MCLLVFAWQTVPGFPLVVAANRDERLDRPSHSLCVLREHDPRILGGRDELAGGTWLAVNQHGVVAGLTNRPSPGGRDPAKRSRGELPMLAASYPSAADGVADLMDRVEPAQYNPAWLLIGDRDSLHYIELASDRLPQTHTLGPGVHILENVGLGAPSAKVTNIRLLIGADSSGGAPLWDVLPTVLADHSIPITDGEAGSPEGLDTSQPNSDVMVRPLETRAACVHTDNYGTRSSALVRIPADRDRAPEMLVADGPPCTSTFVETAFAG
jgi:uncharacterized protein with NRDE domain